MPSPDTSWQQVADSYNRKVGGKGHYFHQHVVWPNLLPMLELSSNLSLLDLACGQGVLARNIPALRNYLGIDKSSQLIKLAKETKYKFPVDFRVGDICEPVKYAQGFDRVAVILALQNVEDSAAVFRNIAVNLLPAGKAVVVINHPMFRIPRQTSWEIDEKQKMQYRRVNRYLSELKIPIDMTPGGGKRTNTWSFHRPLSEYFNQIAKAGMAVTDLQEWVSDKQSMGSAKKMENLARQEFPLFMAMQLVKLN